MIESVLTSLHLHLRGKIIARGKHRSNLGLDGLAANRDRHAAGPKQDGAMAHDDQRSTGRTVENVENHMKTVQLS